MSVPMSVVFVALGITSIFVDMSIWVFYGTTIGILLSLNIQSRLVIRNSERRTKLI